MVLLSKHFLNGNRICYKNEENQIVISFFTINALSADITISGWQHCLQSGILIALAHLNSNEKIHHLLLLHATIQTKQSSSVNEVKKDSLYETPCI